MKQFIPFVRLGHPGQPLRLQAKWRSRARGVATRIPRSPRVRTGREFDFPSASSKIKKPETSWSFFILVEAAGIEPASASPLQAVLHT